MQDQNFNQLKLKVNDTYEKDEKITAFFQPSKDEVVINKDYKMYPKQKVTYL